MNFLKLVIAKQGKNQISVVTQKETAEFFGWAAAFPEWRPQWKNPEGNGGWHPGVRWQPDPRFSGGQRLFICRDKSKQGHPRGKTHCFRMHGSFSRRHLVELARVAGDEFEWMEGKYGARISRADWLDLVRD